MDNKQLLHKFVEAGIPALITGEPGTGKTGHVRSLQGTRILGREVRVIQLIASVREPADIGGYPVPNYDKGYVELMPVNWGMEAKDLYDEGKFVIVFLDELRCVTAPQQAALMKCIHENRVGDLELPAGVRWVAAANSVDQSAGGVPLEGPLANRMAHLPKWSPNYKEWVEDMTLNTYALQSPLSDEGIERLPQERAAIASYIARRSENLILVPTDEDKRDGPWPSPRTWDYVAHAWTTAKEGDFDAREALMAACVGLDQAAQFINWRRTADLPDPEEVLGNTKFNLKSIVDPQRPDRTYAILNSVVAAVGAKWEPKRCLRAWEVLGKCAEENGIGDIAAAMVPTMMRIQRGRDDVPNFGKYVQPFMDLLKRAGWPGVS